MAGSISRIAVLGAGTMGAAIAALCANAGLAVTLLDLAPDRLTPEEENAGLKLGEPVVRNRVVTAGFERMRQTRPPNLAEPASAERITLGNFSDHFAWLAEADWIIEAITEQLAPKRELLARVEHVCRPESVISSNTSALPLHAIAAGRSAALRQRFLGTHFFNPPRYLKLLELIPTGDTLPEVIETVRAFAEERLGKRCVLGKDTAGFIANRLFTFGGNHSIRFAQEHGYPIDEVDALTGPLIGRPRTATFRLVDLTGLDIVTHVARNLAATLPDDDSRDQLAPPEVLERLVALGRLGNKTGAGFYQRVQEPDGSAAYHVLDLATLAYHPPRHLELPLVAVVGGINDPGERLRAILRQADQGDRQARLVEAVLLPTLAYTARRVPEISDDLLAIDDTLRWGFGHELGPFETWDALGVAETVGRMQRQGLAVAPWVTELLADGHRTFYRRNGATLLAYSPLGRRYEPVRRAEAFVELADLKAGGRELDANAAASLVDLGDGVLCFEFRSKANSIGRATLELLGRALERLAGEDRWRAMVVGNQGRYFSAGVDLTELLGAAEADDPANLAEFLRLIQEQLQRVRFSPKPVVAAPFGQTLALGAELALACARCCAEGDVAMGLVEARIGLLPAGGGCKELVRRQVSAAMRRPGADPLPPLRHLLAVVGQARVSTSAPQARANGFLADEDRVVLGRDRLIWEAKKVALDLATAGYRPPAPDATCYAAGRAALAALQAEIDAQRADGALGDQEVAVHHEIARVLCGGDRADAAWVDEAQFLDLEREGISRLLRQERTRHRVAQLLRRT